jgi:hypothetical protein
VAFSRHNIQEIVFFELEEMSFEFALFAGFFGNGEFVSFLFVGFEFPNLRVRRFVFRGPLANQALIEDNVFFSIEWVDGRDATGEGGYQGKRDKSFFHGVISPDGLKNTRLAKAWVELSLALRSIANRKSLQIISWSDAEGEQCPMTF